MTLTRYLLFLLFSTLLCWASWLLVIFRINPNVSGAWGPFFFYLTLFFALTGTLALIGFGIRSTLFKKELLYKLVAVSFRQALLLSGVAVISLLLQANHLLEWWSLGLLALGAAAIEALVRSANINPATNNQSS